MIDIEEPVLSTKEGWERYVNTPAPEAPDRLRTNEIRGLSEAARQEYNDRRAAYHANIGPLKTPQLTAVYDELNVILKANQQTNDKAKGIVAIDGPAGVGKTTTMFAYGRDFHRAQLSTYGPQTSGGHQRWPVCRVGLTGNPTVLDFSKSLLGFFAHPGERGNSRAFAMQTLDLITHCGTKLLIVDDFHFIRPRFKHALDVSNQLKFIANDFPVTIVVIGVGLTERGVFAEGTASGDERFAQLLRRTTVLPVERFTHAPNNTRDAWHTLLVAIEARLILANKRPGMLADDLTDYLYDRTGGYIGSLMTLIQRGCVRAVDTGHERLTKALLEPIHLDLAAEKDRTPPRDRRKRQTTPRRKPRTGQVA